MLPPRWGAVATTTAEGLLHSSWDHSRAPRPRAVGGSAAGANIQDWSSKQAPLGGRGRPFQARATTILLEISSAVVVSGRLGLGVGTCIEGEHRVAVATSLRQ